MTEPVGTPGADTRRDVTDGGPEAGRSVGDVARNGDAGARDNGVREGVDGGLEGVLDMRVDCER